MKRCSTVEEWIQWLSGKETIRERKKGRTRKNVSEERRDVGSGSKRDVDLSLSGDNDSVILVPKIITPRVREKSSSRVLRSDRTPQLTT